MHSSFIESININLQFSFHPLNWIFIEINSLQSVDINFVNVIYVVYPKLYVMYASNWEQHLGARGQKEIHLKL